MADVGPDQLERLIAALVADQERRDRLIRAMERMATVWERQLAQDEHTRRQARPQGPASDDMRAHVRAVRRRAGGGA